MWSRPRRKYAQRSEQDTAETDLGPGVWDAAFLALHVMGAAVSAAQIPGRGLQSIKRSSEINTKKPSVKGKMETGLRSQPEEHRQAPVSLWEQVRPPSLVKYRRGRSGATPRLAKEESLCNRCCMWWTFGGRFCRTNEQSSMAHP